eukprot:TRINITY_DN22451_c0_g1_i1.p1 TRINITY_DN22451_c0_g1~~TRINITY_DN22451_c0_g1_i1.p1  ORF type:complete len:363 (-),score=100.84 TRINITY_DN22451_c0_g1_i1:49-1137(-)
MSEDGEEEIHDELFGDDDGEIEDSSSSDEEQKQQEALANLEDGDNGKEKEKEDYENPEYRETRARDRDDDDEGEAIPDVNISCAKYPRFPDDAKLYFVKLPNIVGIEHRPFDAINFSTETDEKQLKSMNPETVVRWRNEFDERGRPKRESNARIVRWSDGTIQLVIGGKEFMDVNLLDIRKENQQIFRRQKGSIHCHGVLSHKLFISPSSIHSQAHQKFTRAIANKSSQGKRKIKLVSIPTENPEEVKRRQEQVVEKKIKDREELQRKRNRTMMGRGGLQGMIQNLEYEADSGSSPAQSGSESDSDYHGRKRKRRSDKSAEIRNGGSPVRRKRQRTDEEDEYDRSFIKDSSSGSSSENSVSD